VNTTSALCESAAAKLGVRSLRAVTPADLRAGRARLGEREHACAYHVVGENQRVIHGAQALRDGDFAQFGHFLFLSHESSRDHFQNSCRELDLLVDLARAHPGCLGARLTGGGFGGATINLVRLDELESFTKMLAWHFERSTGRRLAPRLCKIVDGADLDGRRPGRHRVWAE
jgi:galactokinase